MLIEGMLFFVFFVHQQKKMQNLPMSGNGKSTLVFVVLHLFLLEVKRSMYACRTGGSRGAVAWVRVLMVKR